MRRESRLATAVNMFPMGLPKQFIAREGEAPAEPLHRWLGWSLALPKVFNGIDFTKMFRAVERGSCPSWGRNVSAGASPPHPPKKQWIAPPFVASIHETLVSLVIVVYCRWNKVELFRIMSGTFLIHLVPST